MEEKKELHKLGNYRFASQVQVELLIEGLHEERASHQRGMLGECGKGCCFIKEAIRGRKKSLMRGKARKEKALASTNMQRDKLAYGVTRGMDCSNEESSILAA